ncbi:hypothetical protein SKAU_G00054710 [Synaphobranchus kaupii]|uniref:Ig-like domain-containing protein n=1 Tax=Synaphobranchus kaupii TaxID=118154 RepID=A0A9Q1G466_SYNKA|nr:hypothetical protein SKAU_G00054710 [Synaphobranchus kaupii]
MAGAKGLFLAGYLLSGGLSSELTISYVPKHIEALSGSCVLIPFPPRNTRASISPSGPLLNGSPVTLTCSSWANPPVSNFTWFRTIEATVRSSGRTLTFNVSSGDAGRYHCEAQNQQGKQKSGQVKLTIEGLREPLSQSNPSLDPSKAVNTRETTALESPQGEVQYAEIELSKLGAQGKGKRGKEDRQGQETEYAEIQFSERKGKAPIEDVYAEVKPKSHR